MSATDSGPSDLDQLRAAFVPRDAALCRRLSRVIVPTGDLIGAALLCAWLGTVVASLPALLVGVVTYKIMPAEADGSRPLVAIAACAALAVALFAVWLQFGRWASRRRARARALFRDGNFVQGTVTRLAPIAGRRGVVGTSIDVTFAAERNTLTATLRVHAVVKSLGAVPLLYLPGYERAAAFPLEGRAVVARVGRL